jgi:hypothetical protein
MQRKPGRPLKCNKELCDIVEKELSYGRTVEQVCNNVGIGETTFYDYKVKYQEFSEAIKNGRKKAIQNVENSLFKCAMGFVQKKKIAMKCKKKYPDGTTEEYIDTETIDEFHPPIPTCQIFFLKNRDPKHWSDDRQDDEPVRKIKVMVEIVQPKVNIIEGEVLKTIEAREF